MCVCVCICIYIFVFDAHILLLNSSTVLSQRSSRNFEFCLIWSTISISTFLIKTDTDITQENLPFRILISVDVRDLTGTKYFKVGHPDVIEDMQM